MSSPISELPLMTTLASYIAFHLGSADNLAYESVVVVTTGAVEESRPLSVSKQWDDSRGADFDTSDQTSQRMER